jgi:hypothetical protein
VATAVSEVVYVIQERCNKAEDKRCQLFRLLHPGRAEFEKEGWPGDRQREAAP